MVIGSRGIKEITNNKYGFSGIYKRIRPIFRIYEQFGPRFEYPIHLGGVEEAKNYIAKYLKKIRI